MSIGPRTGDTRVRWKYGAERAEMGVCRVRGLISSPLPQLWDFLVRAENMHLWGPLTAPVTGFDRPMQAGDELTQCRQDYFRRYSQVVLIEKVEPNRSLVFRDLSPAGRKLDARAVISVEAADDKEATWIDETIFYSLGNGRALQWLDRWAVNPLMRLATRHKTKKAFRRLEAVIGRAANGSVR
jgi:uncharacterized protein YndB with AHSA1/START domain